MDVSFLVFLAGFGSLVVVLFGCLLLLWYRFVMSPLHRAEAQQRDNAHVERMRSLELGIPLPDASPDSDEAAARVLGAGLRRARLSSEAVAEVMAVFWAADAPNRRALANIVAGMAVSGPGEEGDVLAVVRSLGPPSEATSGADKKSPLSEDIRLPSRQR